jgi:hypothetical protein
LLVNPPLKAKITSFVFYARGEKKINDNSAAMKKTTTKSSPALPRLEHTDTFKQRLTYLMLVARVTTTFI